MSQQVLGRHYTVRFARYLQGWAILSFLSFIGLILYFIFVSRGADDFWVPVGGISIVIFGLFIYTLPSLIACVSGHPSRSGVYFVNWLLGWTFIGWVVAMAWAFNGYNARMEVLNKIVESESKSPATNGLASPKRVDWGHADQSDETATSSEVIAPPVRKRLPLGVRIVAALIVVAVLAGIAYVALGSDTMDNVLSKLPEGDRVSGLFESKQQAGEQEMAAEAQKSNVIRAVARGLSGAPGAIVCSDYGKVAMLFDLYNHAWEEHMQDRFTNGQSTLIRGKAADAPDPEDYGCHLISPGTPMLYEKGAIVPIAVVQLADGTVFRGTTLDAMMAKQGPVASVATYAEAPATPAASPARSTDAYETPSAWNPYSQTANAVTGPIVFSDHMLQFGGMNYEMKPVQTLSGQQLQDVAKFLSLDPAGDMDGFLFLTRIAANTTVKNGNTPCGSEDVNWSLVVITKGSSPTLNLAFLSGSAAPSLDLATLNNSSQVCGTFEYVSATAK